MSYNLLIKIRHDSCKNFVFLKKVFTSGNNFPPKQIVLLKKNRRSPTTPLEKPSVTQDENSVAHVDRGAQSMVLADFSDHSTWMMMEFSVTLVFRSCVTLGFFLTVMSFRNCTSAKGKIV
jgi:hypothetical protein